MSRIRFFAPAAAWALVILGFGSIPSPTIPAGPLTDKLGHFLMFGVLGALLAYGLQGAQVAASLAWPLLAGIVIGTLDELHQRGVPGRSSDWRDLLADTAGCAIALWLTHRFLERRAARATRAGADVDRDDGAPVPNERTSEHRA